MANEKRLIKVVDATAVYNGIALYMAENAYLNDTALDVLKMVANWLNEAPTVQAVEVVHGSWIEDDRCCRRYCSVCEFEVHDDASFELYGDYLIKPNFCPNCGAKMDGGN